MNEELVLAIDERRKYSTSRLWFIPVLLSECDVPTLIVLVVVKPSRIFSGCLCMRTGMLESNAS